MLRHVSPSLSATESRQRAIVHIDSSRSFVTRCAACPTSSDDYGSYLFPLYARRFYISLDGGFRNALRDKKVDSLGTSLKEGKAYIVSNAVVEPLFEESGGAKETKADASRASLRAELTSQIPQCSDHTALSERATNARYKALLFSGMFGCWCARHGVPTGDFVRMRCGERRACAAGEATLTLQLPLSVPRPQPHPRVAAETRLSAGLLRRHLSRGACLHGARAMPLEWAERLQRLLGNGFVYMLRAQVEGFDLTTLPPSQRHAVRVAQHFQSAVGGNRRFTHFINEILVSTIPAFHAEAHLNPECRYILNPKFIAGSGKTDGETCERGWADLNMTASSAKEMSLMQRCADALLLR